MPNLSSKKIAYDQNNKRITEILMSLEFKDHFSINSENYKKYRPEYPAALFAYLASISPAKEIAWDCGTGSGQTAKGLINFFKRVVASDPSRPQIENAKEIVGIKYLVATAENSSLENENIDLITVSQALHWFRIGHFFKESERVLKPNGILAVWSYNLLSVTPSIDKIISHFYSKTLGDYWPKERRLVENGYNEIVFPFMEVIPPNFEMKAEWNLHELIGYISTWSAVKEFQSANNASPIGSLYEEACQYWCEPSKKMTINWPLTLKIRKKIT
ncbi:MAG: class I SAM-dependent methyltransferase [Desulfobulbaceae bacterium]|nr:class I SAM-dependent methyltransferase [Desulfobulbaceae bacterium]